MSDVISRGAGRTGFTLGSPFLRGFSIGATPATPKEEEPKEISDDAGDAEHWSDGIETTVRCAFAGCEEWSYTGPAGQAKIEAAEHRAVVHDIRTHSKYPARKKKRQWGSVRNQKQLAENVAKTRAVGGGQGRPRDAEGDAGEISAPRARPKAIATAQVEDGDAVQDADNERTQTMSERTCTEVEGCGNPTVASRGPYSSACADHKHLAERAAAEVEEALAALREVIAA